MSRSTRLFESFRAMQGHPQLVFRYDLSMDSEATGMKQKILIATISQLDEVGEENIRLRRIANEVGIREPTIFHYFQNREDLIVSGHVERFRLNVAMVTNPFLAAVPNCQSREEFLQLVKNVFYYSFQDDRIRVRSMRSELLGNAQRRPALRDAIRNSIDSSMAATTEAIEFAKQRGWIGQHVDARAFVVFTFSLISSLVVPEILDDTQLLGHWQNLAIQTISAVVLSDSP